MAVLAPLLLPVPQVRIPRGVVRHTLRAVPSSSGGATPRRPSLAGEVPHACRRLRPDPDPSIFEELSKRRRRAQIAARHLVDGRLQRRP